MTQEELGAVQKLREQGYAVIVWTPEELEGAPPRKVEDRSIELGWEVIDALKEGDEE
jgi:hypothetical protein